MSAPPKTLLVALAGNPNSGKTSLFNHLTGLRQRIGNYPGITVEKVQGTVKLNDGSEASLLDLPGCYSLYSRAPDERIARDALLGLVEGTARPDVVLAVADASNLERNLYFVTQLLETGMPVVVALNMIDVAEQHGRPVDAAVLEEELGVPVVPVIARTGHNFDRLKAALSEARVAGRIWQMDEAVEDILAELREAVRSADIVPKGAREGEALRLMCHARDEDPYLQRGGAPLREAVDRARAKLEEAGIDRAALEAEYRYALAKRVSDRAHRSESRTRDRSASWDRILTHKILGPILYLVIMGVIFQAVYSWAVPFMDWIDAGTTWTGEKVTELLGEGMLTSLLVDGVLAGVGGIIIFLPQICLLFLFLTLLEDIGYLSRAAFLVDRVMRGVGLHGKAFIPLMSSFACAIPGIMATRTIENRRERLVTMLVAPLISCSARLPVYALLIAAFIPDPFWGGVTLLSMYVLSVVAALGAAWVLRKTVVTGEPSTFIMELPSYKMPGWRHVLRTVGNRGWVFVKQAGTIILAISVVLWALATFPQSEEIQQQAEVRKQTEPADVVDNWAQSEQVRQSYAGRMGIALEPAIEPLGFDWRIGIGLVTSFAAREVLVSTLGVVFSVGEADETSSALRDKLIQAKKPDGTKAYTMLTAISLMVFFVLACQCMSTLAVLKRETNSWRWPVFCFVYMTALAYVGSLVVYQGGLALGFA
ncbi:MAG: ferrous iron transport protein B [Planctomycetota bacterium]